MVATSNNIVVVLQILYPAHTRAYDVFAYNYSFEGGGTEVDFGKGYAKSNWTARSIYDSKYVKICIKAQMKRRNICYWFSGCFFVLSIQQCESIVSQNMANPAGSGQQKAILLQSSLQ